VGIVNILADFEFGILRYAQGSCALVHEFKPCDFFFSVFLINPDPDQAICVDADFDKDSGLKLEKAGEKQSMDFFVSKMQLVEF